MGGTSTTTPPSTLEQSWVDELIDAIGDEELDIEIGFAGEVYGGPPNTRGILHRICIGRLTNYIEIALNSAIFALNLH